jgi:hypothetical protein
VDGAVVALEVEGDGVEAADEGEVVVRTVAVVEVDTVDGSGVSVEDMFAGIERRGELVAKEIRPKFVVVDKGKELR